MTTTDPGEKSPREIQRELEEERQRLRATGRALQSKLSVGTVIDELLARTRDRGPDYAVGLGRTIRDNPIPVALIGISLAWLMAGGQRASEGRHGRGHGREVGLDDDGGHPRPARPVAAAPAADPLKRPAGEPLREPPPAVGPTDPLRETPATPGGMAATPPPASPRPASAAGAIGSDAPPAAPRPSPLAGDTGSGTSRPGPLAGDTGSAADKEEDEPLRLGGEPRPDRDPPGARSDDDTPLTLGEDARTGDLRSQTPPPASRPLEGDAHPRPWDKTDNEDKS